MKRSILKSKKGQVLLFVVVAMTLSLALGLSIANRTVRTVTNTARTDTYSRLRASSDAVLEKYLAMPVNDLEVLSENGLDPSATETFENVSPGDNVDISVDVWVETTNSNTQLEFSGHSSGIFYRIEKGTTAEYRVSNLGGTQIWLCWIPENAADNVAVHLSFYNTDSPLSSLRKYGIKNRSSIPGFSGDFDYVTNIVSGSSYYCTNSVSVPNTADVLRATSLLSDVTFGVAQTNLDDQLYKIRVHSEQLQDGVINETHEAAVYKSYPFIALPFDFAVYSESTGIE